LRGNAVLQSKTDEIPNERIVCVCLERLFEGLISHNECRVGHDRARVVGRLISSGKDERKMKRGINGKEKERERERSEARLFLTIMIASGIYGNSIGANESAAPRVTMTMMMI